MERPNAWKSYTDEQIAELESLCGDYATYISDCKTERECTSRALELACAAGYESLDERIAAGTPLKAGDKLWACCAGKTVMLVHVGKRPLSEGLNIVGSHIDSPRLDIKQNPAYESADMAYLDTHYYGGVKKYQWVTLPLALHGVVALKSGEVKTVVIGEDAADPVFCVTDLLVHLSGDQLKKTGREVIEGEDLDLLVGGRPVVLKKADTAPEDSSAPKDKDAEKEPVKAMLLSMLQERLSIDEEDLLSAELEVVPAGAARDLGFDRSMIIGYGHDDRSCAYTSLAAQLAIASDVPERTAVCLLVDKEEIGSRGATSMSSRFFENVMAELLNLAGETGDLPLRRCLTASRMLSSDVSAGFDPLYASAFETRNSAYLGRGLTFNKFTGSGGKSGSNDANAEYVAFVRRVMDEAHVAWQTAELGRIDVGGGGTIAYILANYGMDVIDCGIPVLSMHAPWEVVNKADVYEAYRGYRAFLATA
ncbi:MAG: aminopeptidase [Coriobacteriia bacterium]|nr:aminopeptidase [Coriobacteriia bacterium]MBS5479298.1 aminopeptidase [Coriobacteriia bacterium]